MDDGIDSFEQLVEKMRETGGALRVVDLLSAARKPGMTHDEAWRATVEACDQADLQRTWTDWEGEPYQSEIGLRLNVLVETDEMVDELIEFVGFFFRASAPELYRPAARAVGRHSWALPELEEQLQSYAGQRGMAVDDPVSLNGERSRRRVLLAVTERYLHAPDGEAAPWPVDLEVADDLDGGPPADVSALAVCCARLLEAGVRRDDFEAVCWGLAEDVHHHLEQVGSQRGLVRVWGDLIRQLESRDRQRAASVWIQNVRQFARRDDRTYSDRLATLWEFDTALAAAADADSELIEAVDGDALGEAFDSADFRWLGRVRDWQWRRRRDLAPRERAGFADSVPEAVDPVLSEFVGEVVAPVESGGPFERAMHRWIAGAVDRVTEPRRWWAHADDSRAMATFLMLDAVRYRRPPRDGIRRLLETAGIADGTPEGRETDHSEGLPGTPWSGFHDLLWYVYRREGSPERFPVESETFTSIERADRLLAFVRTGSASLDLDIIVDALEHFARLELATEPEFDIRDFLFRVAARSPHASLFGEFAGRARGRTYRDAEENEVDVGRLAEGLAGEVRMLQQGSWPEVLERDDEKDGWFPELDGVRRSLVASVEDDDLHTALTRFADQLDPRIPHPATRDRGLVDLVVRAIPEGGAVLMDSRSDVAEVETEAFVADLAEQTRRLRELADAMFAGASTEVGDLRRAARNAVRVLTTVRERLEPCIPPVDGDLVAALVARLVDRVGDWSNLLEEGVETPMKGADGEIRGAESSREVFGELAEATAEGASPPMRTRAFRITYELLAPDDRFAGGSERVGEAAVDEEHWRAEARLLADAAEATDEFVLGERWDEFLADRWERLAAAAMELQAEAEVVELVTDPAYTIARRRVADSAVGDQVEQWLMDRYHVDTLVHFFRDQGADSTGWFGTRWRVWAGLGANFTHVWLALLVGAVMILDFGDAWVELARQADMAGIGATFGMGLGGTFLYLLFDLEQKTHSPFDGSEGAGWLDRFGRVVVFLVICFLYTVLVTSGLWYLFSGTELVLHGQGAVLHILVWTGFALFVGVFFGLLTEAG